MPGALQLLPAAIGVPLINVWVRSYKRRFGELSAQDAPPAAAV